LAKLDDPTSVLQLKVRLYFNKTEVQVNQSQTTKVEKCDSHQNGFLQRFFSTSKKLEKFRVSRLKG